MRLSRLFPPLEWIPRYRRADLGPDLAAGLSTAILLVPQAMAYAMLAGLPPEVGLYAAVVPPAIYAFLGTSRQLAVGPVAMDSLLVAVSVRALGPSGPEEYIALAVLLALIAGLAQIVMGALRLGFLTNFLSRPVISGFTSAAALIIASAQLKHLLGLELERSTSVLRTWTDAAERIGQTSLPTLALGGLSVALLLLVKKLAPRVPGALLVVVLGVLAVKATGLAVAVVGDVPAGLPKPALPALRLELWGELLPAALTIALVGFMESISVSQALATRSGHRVEASQELIALGAANLGGAFFGAYPVTGGFSRSAVNAQAGARTQVAGLVTALLVLLALLFLTPLFHDLPRAALAAIIVTAVLGLVDLETPKRLWRIDKVDLALLGLTFALTLGLGVQLGIGLGVLAGLLLFVVRSTRPHFAVLGRLPGTRAYWNVKNHPEAETLPGVLVVRFDAQIYFGNVSFLESTLERLEGETGELRAVVLDFSSINRLDSSAEAALAGLVERYRSGGLVFRMAQAKRPVLDVLERSGLAEILGRDAYHLTLDDALADLSAEGPRIAADAPQR